MEFKCKFCGSIMKVTALEYKSNQYCNGCFEDRAKSIADNNENSFSFNGEIISIVD